VDPEALTTHARGGGAHRELRRRRVAVLVLITVAGVAVALAISRGSGPSRQAVEVQAVFRAYLNAANAYDGPKACGLLAPPAQIAMQRLAASAGERNPPCEARFQRPANSSSSRPLETTRPIVIDYVTGRTAAAHEQGSADRVSFSLTDGRWLISDFSLEPPNGRAQSPASRALSGVAFVLIVLGSIVMGQRRVRLRWVAAAAALPTALGAWSDSQQPSSYDLRGLGLLLGVAGTLLYLCLVLAGRFALPRSGPGRVR